MSRPFKEHVSLLKYRVSQRYYSSFLNAQALSTLALVANTLYASPFLSPEPFKADQIAINVTTKATGLARLGVYLDSDGAPNKLILDAGEVDTGATGVKTIAITLTLLKNRPCWLAIVSNAASTIRSIVAGGGYPTLGLASDLGANITLRRQRTFTYAPLPDPFGTSSYTTGAIFAVFLRKA